MMIKFCQEHLAPKAQEIDQQNEFKGMKVSAFASLYFHSRLLTWHGEMSLKMQLQRILESDEISALLEVNAFFKDISSFSSSSNWAQNIL